MSIPVTESTNGVPCSCRPSEETFLRCSRCSKPICGPCMVRTPVGMRCPECAGVAMTFGPLSAAGAIRALIFGLIVAIPVGFLWGLIPAWGFYVALLMGFAGAEMVARGAPGRRGPELQAIAVIVMLVGLAVSRAVLASRVGLSMNEILAFDPVYARPLWLRPLPDLVFAAVPMVIAFFRFR